MTHTQTAGAEADVSRLIAREVRAEVARQGLSRASLAAKTGRGQNWLARRFRGEVAFSVAELLELAEVLGVPVTQFLPTGAVR